jgi:protocatechuate 3,4-dioxygenase beta subunit
MFFFHIISFHLIQGQQITDSQGVAVFNTIYPGWYQGRATHMHIKVHIGASLVSIGGVVHITGGHVSHTGQLFFDDTMTDAVANFSPYSTNTIQRKRNNEDMIYLESNGATMILPITFPANTFTGGMASEMTVGVDPTATPIGDGGGPPPFPPPTGR